MSDKRITGDDMLVWCDEAITAAHAAMKHSTTGMQTVSVREPYKYPLCGLAAAGELSTVIQHLNEMKAVIIKHNRKRGGRSPVGE